MNFTLYIVSVVKVVHKIDDRDNRKIVAFIFIEQISTFNLKELLMV